MRSILTTIFISLFISSFSQDFLKVDDRSRKVPNSATKSVESLAKYLNEGTQNDLEKVRAYYIWITHNVNYDVLTFFSNNPNPKTKAIDALKRKLAICQGYSELFKALCDYSEIPSFLISGYSKGYGFNPNKKLTNADHAWNAVFVNNKWHLLDATWGAGYLNEKRQFVKKYFEEFFLTDPKTFIFKHLPADPMWQLLDCPISATDFLGSNEEITSLIKSSNEVCFNYNDTIANYQKLDPVQQYVESAERSFRFNTKNFEIAGFAYLNLAYELSLGIQDLYTTKQYAKALTESKQILEINQKAYSYLSRSKSDQGKNAARICKQNMESLKKSIKSLEDIL